MRVCLIYDCLFPYTIGGAERWYRSLGERLAAGGHQVTYLTLRQWEPSDDPDIPGVDVHAVGPRMQLYSPSGRRRIMPPLIFGAGVLWHLLRNPRRYDVVHTASFPYFSLLAAAVVRTFARYRLVVDWHEVWTRAYWQEYLGAVGGSVGWAVQHVCARIPHRAFCFSALHAARLEAEGRRGETTTLTGEYQGPCGRRDIHEADPVVVFAGRHIPEKRASAIPPAIAEVRRRLPELRASIMGDGPERAGVLRAVIECGLGEVVDVPGFVATEAVQESLSRALCLLLPSRREGYGLVVIEAAAHGTPSIVVADPDNAAVELVTDGENGFVARSASPRDLASAIVRVYEAGPELRRSTAEWFVANAPRLSLEGSLQIALDAYGASVRGRVRA
jgi:glycosyltransferase involved in cell wall biosynthesis